ncbi:hypothetical protein CI109_100162 [Kwoniella shandongensis]|uniref:Uncharacterized protein n=1 Tax=Kwoniella shandongensis TaxID=1734106 RepID=A0A5M6BV03_9TREE|nr:uncharacterized protein CI109_005762 [Kwoniella shandongensis]KAA5525880.1 hypothetical protein CI109_005762 [Kwoniella shandongensis]
MESQRPAQLPPRGLPILSGPPPITESSTCRQCAKEFNVLWRRKHTCGHCGYEYCSNCLSDGQALMPRRAGQGGSSTSSSGGGGTFAEIGAEIRAGLGLDDKRDSNYARVPNGGGEGSGYEVESVCLYCLGMLQVTAAPLPILRSLPIKRLKDYLAAYGIPCVGPKEKEDFVQAVIKARNPSTGCLSPEAESYYRRRSVPKQGQPPRPNGTTPARPNPAQARPPPPSSQPRTYASSYRPPPPIVRPGPPPAQTYARPPPPRTPQYAPRPAQPRPPPAQARPPPATPPQRQPSPPVPTILSLVSLPTSYLSNLGIGTLKAILYENHVRVDFKQVLEKDELIGRVSELVQDERKRLERQRILEEQEENGNATAAPLTAEGKNGEDEGATEGEAPGGEGETVLPSAKKSVPTGPMPEIDRGLCVVCQDEEATLAVVDCGHLCMCAHCSDLIMATSQECPLCRTRIVTPQRLIRIYRT